MRTASLSLETVRLDGGTQCRAELSQDYIAGMAEAWSDGAKIPAVVVFHDGSAYWLADGFHRYHAAQKCDFRDIEAEIHSGTRTDAVRYALGANSAHGQPRTNADKRRAVEIALKEFPKLSSRELAAICAVGDDLVLTVKKLQVPVSGTSHKVTGADGKSYPATKPAKTPGMKMLESMGATIVDMRKPVVEVDEETKAAFTAGGREIIAGMAAQKQEQPEPQPTGSKTSWALIYATMAIDQLKKISNTDPKHDEALANVSNWITQNTNTK